MASTVGRLARQAANICKNSNTKLCGGPTVADDLQNDSDPELHRVSEFLDWMVPHWVRTRMVENQFRGDATGPEPSSAADTETFLVYMNSSQCSPSEITVKVVDKNHLVAEGRHEIKTGDNIAVYHHFTRTYAMPLDQIKGTTTAPDVPTSADDLRPLQLKTAESKKTSLTSYQFTASAPETFMNRRQSLPANLKHL